MKSFVSILMFLVLHSTAFAKPLTLTCKSPNALPDAVLKFSSPLNLQEVLVGTDSMWVADRAKFDVSRPTDATALASSSQVLRSLVAASRATPGSFSKVEVSVVTSKSTSTSRPATVRRQLEILGDDAAGIAYVILKNAAGEKVTSAVMIGWAGVFIDCK